jgi:hypothetical protein
MPSREAGREFAIPVFKNPFISFHEKLPERKDSFTVFFVG